MASITLDSGLKIPIPMYDGMNFGHNYMESTNNNQDPEDQQTRTFTWSDTVSNLRYIKLGIWSKENGGTATGYLSNVQFAESDQSLLLGKAN